MNLTKDEALQKIKELEDYINQKDNEIGVPDCIKIERYSGCYGDGLHIVFPDGKKSLGYNDIINDFIVNSVTKVIIKCKLVEVKESELKAGYTYFRTDYDIYSNASRLAHYCKYLGNKEYVFINDGSVKISNFNLRHRYQVVPLD